MGSVGSSGPVVVCLDDEHDVAALVQCGSALARLSEVPLCLAFILVLPAQRPLGVLSEEEERRANVLLDVAVEHAAASGVVATEEIWTVRNWREAIQQMAEDLKASAVIVGWRGSGPLGLFDAGRTLLKDIACPVIMVGRGTGRRAEPSWPPSWLSELLLEPQK